MKYNFGKKYVLLLCEERAHLEITNVLMNFKEIQAIHKMQPYRWAM